MIPFADEPHLDLAIFRLQLGAPGTTTSKGTAWLVTAQGHLISCGHIFWDSPSPYQITLSRKLPGGGEEIIEDVTVVEIGSKRLGLDYSILKILPSKIPKNSRLLRIHQGQGRIRADRKVVGCGVPAITESGEHDGLILDWTGTVEPGSPLVMGQAHYKIRCNDDARADGSSGGPVLLRKQSGIPAVFAIQTDAEGRWVRLALPIRSLTEQSAEYREILALQDPWVKISFIRDLQSHELEPNGGGEDSNPAHHFCLALHRPDFDLGIQADFQTSIRNANDASKTTLLEILDERHRPKPISTRLYFQPVFDGEDIPLGTYLSRDGFKDGASSRLRSIVNISGHEYGPIEVTDTMSHSHVVSLSFIGNGGDHAVLENTTALEFHLPETPKKVTMETVCTLIHDIDVDSGIFHSIGLLPKFYTSPAQRQMLSLEKAHFIAARPEYGNLYGITTDFHTVPYVPFGGVGRNSFGGQADIEKTRNLWTDFLWHLFRPGEMGAAPESRHAVTCAESLAKLMGSLWPEMKGRLSVPLLAALLHAVPPSPTSLRFAVVCVHATRRDSREAASLRRIYRKSKTPRPGNITIVDAIHVLGLAGLRHPVKILPFDYRPGNRCENENLTEPNA